MKCKWIFIFFAAIITLVPMATHAFYSQSTNFSIQQKIQSISGQGNSTNFKIRNAGGQTADFISNSTSFKDFAGILKFLFKSIKPDYDQKHFHWRNDDGSESAATSATSGNQDTTLSSLNKNTTIRLRLEISNEGGTRRAYSTQQFRIEYGLLSTTCSAIGSWTDVGAVGGDWDMSDSTNLTDGANTTNIAVSTGGVTDENKTFIVSNAGVKDTSSQTAALSVPSDSFAELEYSIQALSAATDGGTYCFRVTNAGSATNYTYTQYAQATIASGAQTLSFSISDNSVGFGSLLVSAARYATGDTNGSGSDTADAHTMSASTNASGGYVITINGATLTCNAGSTCGSATINAIGATAAASSPGSEQFGLRLIVNSGTGSASSPYNTANWALDTAAFPDEVATGSGDAATTVFGARYIGNIGVSSEAGDYGATLTYTITGTF